jgi:LuxR family maltose regulon positive regulatory protein
LHQRASEWYGQNGFADQAIEHALRAEDFERAADLIVDHFDVTYQRGEHTKLRDWLAGLPVEWIYSNPHLCILQAWNLFTSGKMDEADERLQCLDEILEVSTDQAPGSLPEQDRRSDGDRLRLVGRAATIRAYLASYSGDNAGTIQYAHRALDNLPAGDYLWRSAALIALGDAFANQGETYAAYEARSDTLATSKAAGDIYLLLIANMRLAETLRQRGKLKQITRLCKQQMQYAEESGLSKTVVTGWLLAIWGEVLAEINQLDEAIHRAKNGAELTERGRDVAMIGWSNLCLIRVLFSMGELSGAERVIRKMNIIAREHDMPIWVPAQMNAWQARIWLAQDKLEDVSHWVRECGLDIHETPTYVHEMETIVLARLLIAQGRLDEAAGLLRRLLDNAEDGGRISRVIEILMLQALAWQAKDDTTQAMNTLERALALAEPGGFIRIFVDEGAPMAHLLYEALDHGIAPNYVRRLLAAFPSAEAEQTDQKKSQARALELVEPLSEREIEVLQLIAEGLTNQEIAARLYLSLNTVKVHSRNIYGKLGVNNRTQAVARAGGLGILSPI